jgi:hypothetical protein
MANMPSLPTRTDNKSKPEVSKASLPNVTASPSMVKPLTF